MPHLRLLRRRGRRWQRLACILHLWLGSALLLTGCADGNNVEKGQTISTLESASDSSESWALAPHAEQLPVAEQVSAIVGGNDVEPVRNSQYWAFSEDTRLVCLPSVDHAELPAAEIATEADSDEPLGLLLAPQESQPPCVLAPNEVAILEVPTEIEERPRQYEAESDVTADVAEKCNRTIDLPAYDELSAEERHLLDVIKHETLGAATGEPTDARLDQVCRERIAAAYALSQRGAAFAARQQLIEVLRKISQAKDNRDGTRSRTESLAAGLRALEEAEDFAPQGSQLEGEMKLEIVCAAHRTPLAHELNLATMLPSQLSERYNRYAQIKLAVAAAGEPAGSMALYSLGKLNSQLAATEPEQNPLATRRAVAFQQAALLAHNENYMAAHELGVLLAESGHYPEAQHLLLQVAVEQPHAVVFRNLARVHEALGKRVEAQLCRTEAEQLAQQGHGPKQSIAWVSPQDFSRNQLNTFTPQMASRPSPNQSAPAFAWH